MKFAIISLLSLMMSNFAAAKGIYNVGLDPTVPLTECQGDCDNDAGCAGDLVCWERKKDELGPPGCTGNMKKGYDYCYSIKQKAPMIDLALSPNRNLNLCEGDCDSDVECRSGLVCYHRRSSTDPAPPGCTGKPQNSPGPWDYCYNPNYNSAAVTGDPHFRTWTGEKFDFHGVCDLVLVQSPHLDIHIRTEKTRVWSYIKSAAVRIGSDILEVRGGTGENYFWLNNVRGDNSQSISLNGNMVSFNQLSAKSREFVIDLGTKGQIKLKSWNSMVSVTMDGGDELFGESLGLMGSYPAGQKLARDGRTIIEDVNAFGEEWQVQSTEPNLFHDIDGPQYPQKCEIPSATQMRRRLGESIITQEDAIVACSRVSSDDFDLCVFDVMATNDKESAGAY